MPDAHHAPNTITPFSPNYRTLRNWHSILYSRFFTAQLVRIWKQEVVNYFKVRLPVRRLLLKTMKAPQSGKLVSVCAVSESSLTSRSASDSTATFGLQLRLNLHSNEAVLSWNRHTLRGLRLYLTRLLSDVLRFLVCIILINVPVISTVFPFHVYFFETPYNVVFQVPSITFRILELLILCQKSQFKVKAFTIYELHLTELKPQQFNKGWDWNKTWHVQ